MEEEGNNIMEEEGATVILGCAWWHCSAQWRQSREAGREEEGGSAGWRAQLSRRRWERRKATTTEKEDSTWAHRCYSVGASVRCGWMSRSCLQSGGTRLVVGCAMQCSAIHPSAMQFAGRCVDPSKINCTPSPDGAMQSSTWVHAARPTGAVQSKVWVQAAHHPFPSPSLSLPAHAPSALYFSQVATMADQKLAKLREAVA
ncbi:unnamed protein product [Triticum turgidum subsp. durum]|uniref:Uncharacterized protein n=1 Tax=Triticum turgidum subsp. durum TaxID=4567 RepID=A0A9R0Q3U9_TRITD|nr:unnamed protein product [Triticum turgidum subsp. durum]